MLDKLVLILLGIWALVTGIFAVTNLRVEWSGPIAGFCALALGVVCLIRAIKSP
jgi:membrane associated rhomboid family serine protease